MSPLLTLIFPLALICIAAILRELILRIESKHEAPEGWR